MRQFSGLDLARWINQFKDLISTSRISQIYRQGVNQVCFALNTKEGKHFLILNPPHGILFTSKQPQSSHKDTGFGSWMRQNLKGAVIKDIKQIKSERILQLDFHKGTLYVEFFNKGNITFTDETGNILITLQKVIQKDRQLVKNEQYKLPESFDIFHTNESELKLKLNECILENDMTASKFFATVCILGGKNAEMICDKLNISSEDSLNILLGKELEVISVFDSLIKEDFDFKIDELEFFEKEVEESRSVYHKKIKKVENIIKQQNDTLNKSLKEIESNSFIGEFIYNNYLFFEELKNAYDYSLEKGLDFNLNVVDKLKEKHSIKGIEFKYVKPELTFELKQ